MAVVASGRRIALVLAVDVRGRYIARRTLLRVWGPGAWMQRRSDQDWFDVQHGAHADDLLRLHVLSVERTRELSDSAKGSVVKSACVCERGISWSARAAVSSSVDSRDFAGAANLRFAIFDNRFAPVST